MPQIHDKASRVVRIARALRPRATNTDTWDPLGDAVADGDDRFGVLPFVHAYVLSYPSEPRRRKAEQAGPDQPKQDRAPPDVRLFQAPFGLLPARVLRSGELPKDPPDAEAQVSSATWACFGQAAPRRVLTPLRSRQLRAQTHKVEELELDYYRLALRLSTAGQPAAYTAQPRLRARRCGAP